MSQTDLRTIATLALLTAPLAALELPFDAYVAIETPFSQAHAVATADLDGDGDLDFVAVAPGNNAVAWFENTAGDGTAWTRHDLNTAFAEVRSLAVGDLDGDGDGDVVAAAALAGEIRWWENDLDSGAACGTDFCQHTLDAAAGSVFSVAVVDVDGDGDLDVVGASRTLDDVIFYDNSAGDASTWVENPIDLALDGARAVDLGDIDGDGDLDVVAGSDLGGGTLTWYENDLDGAGTCVTDWCGTTVDTGATDGVAVADVDGDGDLDLLRAEAGTDPAWWENTSGDGSAWTEQPVASVAAARDSLVGVDLDLDGDTDLLSGGASTWFENTAGDGSAFTERNLVGGSGNRNVAADLDGDGDLDILGAASAGDSVGWYENQSLHRSAVYPDEHTVDGGFNGAVSVSAIDMDGDGDLDVLGAAREGNDLSWWENDGTVCGASCTWSKHTIADDFLDANRVRAADIDGDGDVDVVASAFGLVDWFENDGTACAPSCSWPRRTVATDPFVDLPALDVADVDGDGDLDVLGTIFEDAEVLWWENEGCSPNCGWTAHLVDSDFVGAVAVRAADLDGDGDLDVLGAAVNGFDIAWWENDGSACSPACTWTEHLVDGDFSGARDVAAADVDGDGDLDVLGAASGADDVSWWENDGSACSPACTWTEHLIDGDVNGARAVAAADLDADGDLDVLAAASDADAILWWENDGSACAPACAWPEHVIDGSFVAATSVAAADVDGDVDLDVLGTARNADDLAWWQNRGGQFALPTTDAVAGTAPLEGSTDVALLRIDGAHRGRTGDGDAEVATFELLFEEADGDPLTGDEIDDLLGSLRLHLDDGDGSFDPGLDSAFFSLSPPFALTAGALTATLVDGDANVQLALGADKTWWLAADLAANAGMAVPDTFQVTHVTSASSTGEMTATDLPLILEGLADVTSQTLVVNSAPQVASPILDTGAAEGEAFTLDVTASFTDDGALSFMASGLPSGLSMSGGGVISGTPDPGTAAGSPYTVTVTATDTAGLFVEDAFTLGVADGPGAISVDGVCTLADAIVSANTNVDTGACTVSGSADTITLDADVVLDAGALPDVRSVITIVAGLGTRIERDITVTCSHSPSTHFRLLTVTGGGDLTLEGLTLANGCAELGGALLISDGRATVQNATFASNRARPRSSDLGGGAIAVQAAGTLEVVGATFLGNESVGDFTIDGHGGAILVQEGGTLTRIEGTRFEANLAEGGTAGVLIFPGSGLGGAMHVRSNVSAGPITGCSFDENVAQGRTGDFSGGSAQGGGVYSLSSVTIEDTTFTGNQALAGSEIAVPGRAEGGALLASAGASLARLVFERNLAVGGDNNVINGDPGGAALGGAIRGTIDTLVDATFRNNEARGGTASDYERGGNAFGGGADLDGGPLLERLTFESNRAVGGDGRTGGFGAGGGLLTRGADIETVRNLTFMANEARGGTGTIAFGGLARGGAWDDANSLTASHLTVTGNLALSGTGPGGDGAVEGAGLRVGSGAISVVSSIVSDNESTVGNGTAADDDCFSDIPFVSGGFNLVGVPGTCLFIEPTDLVGVDPLLEPLGGYGCTTTLPDGACQPTMAFSLTSPALDAGSCTTSGATDDARGLSRPRDEPGAVNVDDGCDIGAYEARDENGNGIEDGVELGLDLVFADAFENGDTSRWSNTIP